MRSIKILNALLLIGVIFIILTGIEGIYAEDQSASIPIWNGSWVSKEYHLLILQNGTSIVGSYEPKDIENRDPGVLKGTLSDDGRTFSGIWSESGTISLIMSDDMMSFSGTGSVDQNSNLTPFEYTRTGNRTSEGILQENPWSGTWDTIHNTYTLLQNGTTLSGTYIPKNPDADEPGFIEGRISDNGKILNGSWFESGTFTFRISDDGKRFNGTYTHSLSNSAINDTWNAEKIE